MTRFRDRAAAPTRHRFYTTVKLGPRRELTPDGFLVCYDVPIARIGTMKYAEGETPIDPAEDGFAYVSRDPEDLFRPETMASMLGKPLVNNHPPEDVTPDTWQQLALGSVLNPRRGVDDPDMFVADIMVCDKHGIELVNSGKVEVSCGYDADYEETGKGRGRQRNIIYNHLALVDRGRCGHRCAIGDEETDMKFRDNAAQTPTVGGRMLALLARAFSVKDDGEKAQLMEEARTLGDSAGEDPRLNAMGAVHVHIGSNPAPAVEAPGADAEPKSLAEHIKQNAAEHKEMRDAIEEIRKHLKMGEHGKDRAHHDNEPEPGEGEDAMPKGVDNAALEREGVKEKAEDLRKAKDSAALVQAFRNAAAEAEILSPGIALPAFDSAAKPSQTLTQIATLRREALRKATGDAAIHAVLGGRTVDELDFAGVAEAARVGANLRRVLNTRATTDATARVPQDGIAVGGPRSIADLQKLQNDHWKN